MRKKEGGFRLFYRKLQRINDRVMGVVATVLFSFIYILVLPLFAFFAKKRPPVRRTSWHPWTNRSDTIEDVRKQY